MAKSALSEKPQWNTMPRHGSGEQMFSIRLGLFGHQNQEKIMCDYSLESVASRQAAVGDRLVTTNFLGTPTHGFAAVGEPNVAVCLLPGTELAFDRDIRKLGLWRSKPTGQNLAVFRQLNRHVANVSHDALELADGNIVFVTQLKKGQIATVLQLPAPSLQVRGVATESTLQLIR
jgi:hypothetical protein